MSGTDLLYAATRLSTADQVSSAIRLRACYAMSGTDLAYVASVHAYECVVRDRVLTHRKVVCMYLRACYAMSGSHMPHMCLRACYAVSGTDLAYAATRRKAC
eukprot:3024940-Rhodomonas_salina.1